MTYNGHSYKLYNDGMTWEDAKVYCESIGGHLVIITDENEQIVVENLLYEKGTKTDYWIGGFKNDRDLWQWVTNETFRYSNWEDEQPDNYNGVENFIEIYQSVGKWNDMPVYANENFGLICEWHSGGSLNSNDLLNNVTFAQN